MRFPSRPWRSFDLFRSVPAKDVLGGSVDPLLILQFFPGLIDRFLRRFPVVCDAVLNRLQPASQIPGRGIDAELLDDGVERACGSLVQIFLRKIHVEGVLETVLNESTDRLVTLDPFL
jgi:hypothetical protein